MIKYSILMPYYNREAQLIESINSVYKFSKNRNDFEIIIIYDKKTGTGDLMYLEYAIRLFEIHKIAVRLIPSSASESVQVPCVAYNDGAKEARGEWLMITCPECRFENDIFSAMDKIQYEVNDNYVVFACTDDKLKWRQHSKHKNRLLNFASFIKKDVYNVIGGFDERYKEGTSYDDDDFLTKIDDAGLTIYTVDNYCVHHQTHKKEPHSQTLTHKNRQLYKQIHGVFASEKKFNSVLIDPDEYKIIKL